MVNALRPHGLAGAGPLPFRSPPGDTVPVCQSDRSIPVEQDRLTGKLQLVGATAIFIAAKYEEITAPSVAEIHYMVDGGYTVDEILKAERFMLNILNYDIGWPGPMSFLRRISKADDYDLETRTVAKYFLELTIMDERFVATPPSFISAAAHCLSLLMLRKGCWVSVSLYIVAFLTLFLLTIC